MKPLLRGALLALAVAVLPACADWREGDEHFFVSSHGASMPVWVMGNWRSNRIIVHVHGGPGTTNGIYFPGPAYQRIAQEFGLAYYEQRGSGAAQGNSRSDTSLLTPTQFVQDLDDVLAVLRQRYPSAEFVLAGHSWGGFLTASYLLDAQRQGRVRAWILQDGVVNASCAAWQLGVDEALRQNIPGAADFYRNVYRCDLRTNENNMLELYQGRYVHLWHSLYVRAAGGYDVNPALVDPDVALIQFRSQYDLLATQALSPLPMREYYGIDLTPRLSAVRLPTLILWGTHDLIVPWATAQPIYNALGTPAAQRQLVAFSNSGHNPWAEEPTLFAQSVLSFLRTTVWPAP